jgi:hydroxypyruvate reductase
MNTRHTLLELFDAALRAADGRERVADVLRRIRTGPVAVFAVGKAASAMSLGALEALGDQIASALIITKDGHVDPQCRRIPGVQILESAHPVPDERSLAAGAALERAVARVAPDAVPVFLVSGGSSSLVESLRDGVELDQLRALNERGLAAGWDIRRLNGERSALSRLKGGGIARLLAGRPARALFVSDVPGDDPDVIGSGLLGRDAGRADAIERQIVANVEDAARAAVEAGAARGLTLERRAARFDGEAAEVAKEFVSALRAAGADGLVWGGESTVQLPAQAGRGGRNTHLALAGARLMRAGVRLKVLAAGTDGTDGPTEDAGAVVDAGTVVRAELAGVDVERAFLRFDSGTALEAAEDLVHTGPTGTNVGDILIGLRHSATSVRDASPGRML